ncbi:NTF2-related export protein [Trichinella spiralis]|uniref:NTF2-related export protein n=1 Tax=Trichinella spiralis TaxID=6334 RepID=A0ABR3KGJ0_TRISP
MKPAFFILSFGLRRTRRSRLSLSRPTALATTMHCQPASATVNEKTVEMGNNSEQLPLDVSVKAANELVLEYSDLLTNGGKSLHRLYSIDAELMCNSEEVNGIDAIREHIAANEFRSGVEKVKIVHCQTEVFTNQLLLIQIMGTLKIKNKQGEKMFSQILKVQAKSKTSYYITKEMFQFLDGVNGSGIDKKIVIKKELPQNTDGCEIAQNQETGTVKSALDEKCSSALPTDKQSFSLELNDISSSSSSEKKMEFDEAMVSEKTDNNSFDDESQNALEWKFDDISENDQRRLKMKQFFELKKFKNSNGDEKKSHEEKNSSNKDEKLSGQMEKKNGETERNTWAEVVRSGKSMRGSVACQRPNNKVTTRKSRRETVTSQTRKILLKNLPISVRYNDVFMRFKHFGFIDKIDIRVELSEDNKLKTKSAIITFRDIQVVNYLLSYDEIFLNGVPLTIVPYVEN